MSQKPILDENLNLPGSQEQVIEKLLEQFESFPAQLQIVARYIIDHPYEVGVQTMRTLATKAKVHPNSFVRLARQIGFDGYESMRERFRDFVRNGAGSTEQRGLWLQKMEKAEGSSRVVAEMTESMLGNLEQMMQSQDINKLDQAVKMMLEADRVFVLGLGVGYPLAYNFWYVARMISENFILIPRHGSLAMDDLVNIRDQDLLVCMTFQPYRTDVLEALRYAKDQGARTIGISDSPTSALYRESELGLCSPTHTPQFFHSNVAVIGLLETLTALLVAKGGKKAIRHMEKFSELRWKSGIYEG